ncbi:tetratricopeptide repeat protein, partial [Planctomycetota bacterium]
MKRLGLSLLVVLVASVAIAGALEDARTAMADRRYADAAAILTRAKVEADDYRLYLLANAHFLDGKHGKAIAALDTILAKYPKSTWRSKALFKRADALAKLGRFDEAEKIYEQQIARLASAERRGEIAKVYLTHADQAFEPKLHGERPGAEELQDQKPNYKGALKLYERAKELDALPTEADRIGLRIGLCHYHLKQHDAAIKQLDAFLKEHEKSKLVPDALYHQGLAHIGKKDPDRARASFEKLLRDHADSERAPEARYKIAATYGLPKPRSEGDLNLGARALRTFVKLHPAHKLAPKAGYEVGLSFFNFGQHEKAIEELASFVKAFAKRKDAVEVGKAAYLIGQAHRNLNRFEKAIDAWQAYLRQFPAHEDWQRAQAAIVSASYDHARYLYRKKKWDAAAKGFTDFAAEYPLDGRNAQALYMLGQIPYKQEKWQDAVAAWRRVVSKFPKHQWGYAAQFRIAYVLERKLKAFEKAIEEYKKIAAGPQKAAAERRLRELRDPHLAVTYEKIFHTDQKPTLKVETRNIEKLHFKAYRLNAEDYFRRMGGLERIETLDIALIDPHDEWDVDIKDYKKYEDMESQLELKLEGAGLFAVNVSTEKLEATAMVLVTDLAVLVKSSKKDVLVFAQNLRTGKPQAGARLLVSDGKKVVLEGTTGKDGVYQGASDDLKKVARARVYAVSDGSPASNALNLRGLGVALGLQPRGILYTDRPAYRPGEKVSYRGMIRLVDKGSYATGEGKEVTVRVHSARGDVVHEAKQKLSAFGTLSGEFELNAREPLGECRIVATYVEADEKKRTFTGQFRVDEYQLPLYKIIFDLSKPTYFRGEKIAGKIRVEYYFGHPVPGKDVRYRLKDQRWHTKTTDDKGEVDVEFETDFFRQTETLPLVAVLPAEGVVGSKNVLLVNQEFQATVSTLRATYLVGEGFDAKVKTTDFDNKPVSRKVTVGLYRYVGEEAEVEPLPEGDQAKPVIARPPTGYVKVATKEITTSKETGEAVAQLTGKENGRHLLRVEGLDSKQNLVVAARAIFVSGEDDKIKLRILSDSDEFRVGETPELNFVCRVGPALALVTWEGERVYRYKLVPLKKGSNRIDVEISDECAPNFSLQAAVLHENEFHTAAKHLAVLKMLKVAIETSKKELAPGEEVTVTVKTTDQAGKPVAAEMSLAIVDEALYARYKDKLPKLSDLFHQRRRGRFFVAGASNGFKYAAVTRAASDALRRERDRLARLPGPAGGPVATGAVPAAAPQEEGERLALLADGDSDFVQTEDANGNGMPQARQQLQTTALFAILGEGGGQPMPANMPAQADGQAGHGWGGGGAYAVNFGVPSGSSRSQWNAQGLGGRGVQLGIQARDGYGDFEANKILLTNGSSVIAGGELALGALARDNQRGARSGRR